MTDTHRYRSIPSSDNQVNHSNLYYETALSSRDESHSTAGSNLIRWTYFLLGCAILLPFSALFNPTSFFLSRLAGSAYYPTFGSYFLSAYTWTKLVSQFYCTLTSKRSSPSRRIFASLTTIILLVASLCYSTFVRVTPPVFFAFSLATAACMAVAASYLLTAVYARAAFLGPAYLRSVLAGQVTITLAISVVQVASSIIALWGLSPELVSIKAMTTGGRDDLAEEVAARIFFGASAVFFGAVLVAYSWLTRQSFYKSTIATLKQNQRQVGVDECTELVPHNHPSTKSFTHVYQVFRRNLIFIFSISYVFIATLAIYPAITARVRPVDTGIHPMLFTAFHFFFTNLGGFLGQYSCSFPRLVVWSGKKILAMSLLRTLFIPIILMCNVERPATTPGLPIIRSDILFMMLMLIMGYIYGYVSTSALLAASSVEHNPRLRGRREDVDIMAALGAFCMILGLALGSLCSFGVQAMII